MCVRFLSGVSVYVIRNRFGCLHWALPFIVSMSGSKYACGDFGVIVSDVTS